jgi:cell division protein ZapA
MQNTNFITVKVLDKEFRLCCPPEEEMALRNAAHYLDGQMRQIRHKGGAIGMERITMTAALNMAYELLQLRQKRQETELNAYSDKIGLLLEKLSNATQSIPLQKLENCAISD